MNDPNRRDDVPALPPGVLSIRPGLGANCSSLGSVIDIVFVAGAVSGAVLVALTAALSGEGALIEPASDGGEPRGDEAGGGDAGEG